MSLDIPALAAISESPQAPDIRPIRRYALVDYRIATQVGGIISTTRRELGEEFDDALYSMYGYHILCPLLHVLYESFLMSDQQKSFSETTKM